ncbi:MAG: MGMT family protein [Deltaproteobacteria bacterium]|nr:MGMT family protein [Deltaproteobacteria bacterium]
MKKGKKSFLDKMRPDMQPELVGDPRSDGRMLIPTPKLVAAVVRSVPRGKLITPSAIRARLAREHGADLTCPLTTGIFLNIVAGAAQEELDAGRRAVAPYWRVVKDNGALCAKFPAGVARQAELLRVEGHRVVQPARGKVPRVEGFAARLVAG